MNIILVVAICMLITGNIVLMVGVKSLTKDLKDYQAIIKSTMANNDKLIKLNTELREMSDRVLNQYTDFSKDYGRLLTETESQNTICAEILRDNLELTARLNEVLLHIDDGK